MDGDIRADRTPLDEGSRVRFARQVRQDFDRLRLEHQFAVDEVATKVSILQRELLHLHRYNPIEHVTSRVKSFESLVAKMTRKGITPTADAARATISDIAGLRITCSFIADTYEVRDMLTRQADVTVVASKDYIANPKPNGYKSLHSVVEVPVYLSTGPLPVRVEVQIRTVAMDFWASLEHKIHYKYDGDVPVGLQDRLREAADVAGQLDRQMELMHSEVRGAARTGDVEAPLRAEEALAAELWP